MYPANSPGKHQEWTRDGFMVSTDPSLIDLKALNEAFASDFLYWAKAIPEQAMKDMLDTSLSFGLFAPTAHLSSGANASEPALIGYARLVTDNVTFAYLTDVYVLEGFRKKGLGEWVVRCVQEVLDQMPYLRRSMAILGDERLAKWYQKHMGMTLVEGGPDTHMWIIQRRGNGSAFG